MGNLSEKAVKLWNQAAAPGRAPVAVNLAGNVATLSLYGVVGEDITDRAVADALAQCQGASQIRLYVNSPGGDYFMGKAIYAQLMRAAAACPMVAEVDSLAASAASLLLMAAPRIEVGPQATLMIHEVQALAFGRATDLEAQAQIVRMENATLAGIYARRTGMAPDKVCEMMAAETWLNAEDAVAMHFADGMAEPPEPCPLPSESEDPEDDPEAEANARLRVIADFHTRVARALTGQR